MNVISQTQAIKELLNTNIVALPTETVYGLFGLGNSHKAVNKVYKIKNRPADNPLICHFWNYAQILEHTINQPQYLKILIEQFCPGPITFLLELNPTSDLQPTTAAQTNICCRIPDNNTTLEILEQVNIPLFGPSANSSTKVSGTSPEIIFADIGQKIAGIVDGGECKIGLESTIIDCTNPTQIRILRPGAIGKIEIDKALNNTLNNTLIKVVESTTASATTPGAKYRHYSPRTRIIKIVDLNELFNNFVDLEASRAQPFNNSKNRIESKPYILGFQEDLSLVCDQCTKISLGSINKAYQIAHNLFQNLFSLDKLNIDQIYFYYGPAACGLFESEDSISRAITNRLRKVFTEI